MTVIPRPSLLSPAVRDETRSRFAADLVEGLGRSPKALPPKYFYDGVGSALFEQITQLPEYYPTRTEIDILRAHGADIAALVPEGAVLVEFGSGSSTKIRLLLDHLPKLHAYVPVDISGDFLRTSAAELAQDYPHIAIAPVAADFTMSFALPPGLSQRPLVGFFPGSTLGNFEPREAERFLAMVRALLGPESLFILGVDLIKDEAILNAAYNDAAGITAAFNLNLLARANRELGADFDLHQFEHRAFFNPRVGRVEMHLVSQRTQMVRVVASEIAFEAGETIHTESSYKYTLDGIGALAARSGWSVVANWTDPKGFFSVHALRAAVA